MREKHFQCISAILFPTKLQSDYFPSVCSNKKHFCSVQLIDMGVSKSVINYHIIV